MDADPARVPPQVLLGTSSWIYPGWKGTVYRRPYRSEREFREQCLAEYARWPWFRTVGFDFPYYRPPQAADLRRRAALLPAGFPWVEKVWEGLTVPRWPRYRRYGERAGRANPDFLDPDIFRSAILPPHEDPEVRAHTGALVLQFPPGLLREMPLDAFLERLDAFLAAAVRSDLRLAVEVRDPALLLPDYFSVLNRHGVTHCFTHWTRMPRLLDQMRAAAAAGGLQAPFYVCRLLTPRGLPYAKAVERFQPYDRLQQPIPEMREDALRLARRAVQRNATAFILANNRAEGHAPATVAAIGAALAGAGRDDAAP